MLLHGLHDLTCLLFSAEAQGVHGEAELHGRELRRKGPQLGQEQRQQLGRQGVRQRGDAPGRHIVDALPGGLQELPGGGTAQATPGGEGEDHVLSGEGSRGHQEHGPLGLQYPDVGHLQGRAA